MEDYLNYNWLITALGFLILNIILDIMAKRSSFIFNFLLLGMIGYTFADANNQFETAKSNTKEFNKGAVLKCYSAGGFYSGADTCRVSKKDGWKFDDKYFVKDSISIRVNKCEGW